MRRSSEPEERTQFTVAELLARYGEPSPAAGSRRRRAAEETDKPPQTAAPPIVHSNRADRREQSVRTPGPRRTSDGDATSSSPNGRTGRSWSPAVGPPGGGQRPSAPPPVAARPASATTAVSDGPVTEQLPRYSPAPTQPAARPGRRPTNAQPVNAPPVNTQPVKIPPASGAAIGAPPAGSAPIGARATATGLQAAGPRPTGFHPAVSQPAVSQPAVSQPTVSRSVGRQPFGAQAPAGLGIPGAAIPGQEGTASVEVDADSAEAPSPLWEWAAMVSQVGLGVVGGATLWLICEWLWQRIPVVALVVALGLITAMVWVVRRVRRAEDLQTTVIAVLVGLFVTVSPAALLLVNR